MKTDWESSNKNVHSNYTMRNHGIRSPQADASPKGLFGLSEKKEVVSVKENNSECGASQDAFEVRTAFLRKLNHFLNKKNVTTGTVKQGTISESSEGEIVIPEPKLPETNTFIPFYSDWNCNRPGKYDSPASTSPFMQSALNDNLVHNLPINYKSTSIFDKR